MQEARQAWWKIDLHVAAWTGTLMSFIQEPVSTLPPGIEEISRADECRLMYLSHDNSVNYSKRKKGIGRKLLDMAVHDLFVNAGAASIKLCVGTTNEKALSLYKKSGFKVERSLSFYKLNIWE